MNEAIVQEFLQSLAIVIREAESDEDAADILSGALEVYTASLLDAARTRTTLDVLAVALDASRQEGVYSLTDFRESLTEAAEAVRDNAIEAGLDPREVGYSESWPPSKEAPTGLYL